MNIRGFKILAFFAFSLLLMPGCFGCHEDHECNLDVATVKSISVSGTSMLLIVSYDIAGPDGTSNLQFDYSVDEGQNWMPMRGLKSPSPTGVPLPEQGQVTGVQTQKAGSQTQRGQCPTVANTVQWDTSDIEVFRKAQQVRVRISPIGDGQAAESDAITINNDCAVAGCPLGRVCLGSGLCGACSPGAKRCDGAKREACSELGEWAPLSCEGSLVCSEGECVDCLGSRSECSGQDTLRTCRDGAWVSSSCSGPCSFAQGKCLDCTPNSYECVDAQTERHCNAETGTWDVSQACVLGRCIGERCAECRETETRCAPAGLGDTQRCIDGRWIHDEACALGCVDGRCRGCLQPGATQCSGMFAERSCDGTFWSPATQCLQGNPVCDPTLSVQRCSECIAGDVSCSPGAASRRICGPGPDGRSAWSAAIPCTGATPACLDGACVQCNPGASRCSGELIQTCTMAGVWGVASACQQSFVCQNSACVRPWLAGWMYRMPFAISNAGPQLDDYQVKFDVDTRALVAARKMLASGNDIRFTASDGTTLMPFWYDSRINTSFTSVWVKVPSIQQGNSLVYMYYGNPAVSGASDRDSTFVPAFGDPSFETAGGWTTFGDLRGASAVADWPSNRFVTDGGGSLNVSINRGVDPNGSYYGVERAASFPPGAQYRAVFDLTKYSCSGQGVGYSMLLNGGQISVLNVGCTGPGLETWRDLESSGTISAGSTSFGIVASVAGGSSGAWEGWFDNIRIRKFRSPEPLVARQNEEVF